MPVSHEVLIERHEQLDRRVAHHKHDLEAQIAILQAKNDANEGELLSLKLWRANLNGVMLVLVPASGVISAILIHIVEKALK